VVHSSRGSPSSSSEIKLFSLRSVARAAIDRTGDGGAAQRSREADQLAKSSANIVRSSPRKDVLVVAALGRLSGGGSEQRVCLVQRLNLALVRPAFGLDVEHLIKKGDASGQGNTPGVDHRSRARLVPTEL
jgi:hypothetical protein